MDVMHVNTQIFPCSRSGFNHPVCCFGFLSKIS